MHTPILVALLVAAVLALLALCWLISLTVHLRAELSRYDIELRCAERRLKSSLEILERRVRDVDDAVAEIRIHQALLVNEAFAYRLAAPATPTFTTTIKETP